MKVIDLLNKIANGEVVPKKIRYNGEEFQFTGYDSASKNYNNELEDLFEVLDGSMLNDEVEIIEPQEHKIPKKIKNINSDYYEEQVYYENATKEELIKDILTLKHKANEILDYLEVNNGIMD